MKQNAWIKSPEDLGAASCCFVRSFAVTKDTVGATLSVSAIGLFEAKLNGQKLGRGVLTPGFTSYNRRVQYITFDLTGSLNARNTLEITAAPGWACGHLGYRDDVGVYSDHYSINAELTMKKENGACEILRTDEEWDVYTSQTLYSDIYNGETLDLTAKMRKLGKAIKDEESEKFPLIPQQGADITEQERLAPIALIHTPKGETVVDFGQNMTGYVEFHLTGNPGDRIRISHAEVLDREGNFYIDNYRGAKNEVIYVLDGDEDILKPSFSFQGFRYIRLDEYPTEEVDLRDIRAIAVHTDMKRTGRFSCGNDKINQLYHNTVWGQKSNYLDLPTDCPQRDERLGWLGDAQVFCRIAALNFDVRAFFRKWLGDMRVEQLPNGGVYGTCPSKFKTDYRARISAAWGDAATIIPWELYLAYGDAEALGENFDMMKRWVEYQYSAGPEKYLWLGGHHYGDWLAMDAGADSYVGATSNDLIATAFYYHSADLVVRAGKILGEDVERYEKIKDGVYNAFRSYFMENGMPKEEFPMTDTARVSSDTTRKGMTQTALVLILHFGLCKKEEHPALAEKLAELIHEAGDLMSTGFVGTPYILHVLSENGYADIAYNLLFEERTPSWLYSVTHGATTMWEHWNSIKEDGSFWSTDMNSFNHYAYGSVCDWLFGVAAGILPKENGAGYRSFTLAPLPDKRLGHVNCSLKTDRGTICSNWYYKGEDLYFEFSVPAGCEAEIKLPNGYCETVLGGDYCYTVKG